MASDSSRTPERSDGFQKYGLRSPSKRNIKIHQCVSCNACSTYEIYHKKQPNTSLTSELATKGLKRKRQDDSKFCERPGKIKQTKALEVHKNERHAEKSKTKLGVKLLKEKCNTNKLKVSEKCLELDKKSYQKSLTSSVIDQPVGLVPSEGLRGKNNTQICTKKKKTKVQKEDKFSEKTNSMFKINKDEKCADISNAKLNAKPMKEKHSGDNVNVFGNSLELDRGNYKNLNIKKSGIDKPIDPVSLEDLTVKKCIQSRIKRKKTKVLKKDKFCRNLKKIAVDYTLKMHTNRKCADKSKTEVEIQKNCNQNSSRHVNNGKKIKTKNFNKTVDKSSKSTCQMNSGEFSCCVLLTDLKKSTNSISRLPKERSINPSLSEDVLKNLSISFLDGPFWQQLTGTIKSNEFMTSLNCTKHIVSEIVEKISEKTDAFEKEFSSETDVTLNNISEGANEDKQAKCNEVSFKIPTAVLSNELTSTFDGNCHESTNVICEEQNLFSDSCNTLDANNSTSDKLNQNLPFLQNEKEKDVSPNFELSDMPELSFMGEKNFALERTNNRARVDLPQNSCPGQTEDEWYSKLNSVISTDEKNQSIPLEIGEPKNDKINLNELIAFLSDDYNDCIVVGKYKKDGDGMYKCGRCCKLFELKTAEAHKNCVTNARQVLMDNLNFLCIKCCTLFENLEVLSSHMGKCLSVNKTAIDKSVDLSIKKHSKSLQSEEKLNLISDVSREIHSSNFSSQHVKDLKSLPEEPHCSFSFQCNKLITGDHVQEHGCKAFMVESINNSVCDNLVSTKPSSNAQNNQTMKSDMHLEDSECPHPVTKDFTSKSDNIDSEMASLIGNMFDCGLLYSLNERQKFPVPPSQYTAKLLSYFQNLKQIKEEPIESDANQIHPTLNNYPFCRKPSDYDKSIIEKTYSSVYSNHLPCSACKQSQCSTQKYLLDIIQYLNEQKKDAFQELLNYNLIRIKKEPNDENLSSVCNETILKEPKNCDVLPCIAQVDTISNDEFCKMKDGNSLANLKDNSLQQEHFDPVNRKIVQNVNINMNSSVSNLIAPHSLSIPEQITSFALSNVNPAMKGCIMHPVVPQHVSFIHKGSASVESRNESSISVKRQQNITENFLQHEHLDQLNHRTLPNVNPTMNGSIPNLVVPHHASIQNASAASHDASSISIQNSYVQKQQGPSEIIFESVFLDPDIFILNSKSEHKTYICGICLSDLMKEQIVQHFIEIHKIQKNKFTVDTMP